MIEHENLHLKEHYRFLFVKLNNKDLISIQIGAANLCETTKFLYYKMYNFSFSNKIGILEMSFVPVNVVNTSLNLIINN